MADVAPWREALAQKLPDYTEWETPQLRGHIKDMLFEKDVAGPRRADELERQIGHACFELVSRRREEDAC